MADHQKPWKYHAPLAQLTKYTLFQLLASWSEHFYFSKKSLKSLNSADTLKILTPFNPGPAEPGYALPLQTV